MEYPDSLNHVGLTEKLIDTSLDGVIAFDTEFRYTIFNPAMERISGLPKSAVLGRSAFEAFPFLLEVGEDEHFKRTVQGRPSLSQGHYTVPETGKTGNYEALYSPLFDSTKKVVGGFAIIREVTEWKRTRRILEETQVKLATLNNVTSDAIITCNHFGEILSWNKSAETIFGYIGSIPLPKHLESIIPGFSWESDIKIAGKPYDLETKLRMHGIRQNGSSVPIQISSSRWTFADRILLTLSIRDLTEINHFEHKADEQREISEAVLEIHEALHQGLVLAELHTHKPLYINQAYANMLGYSVDELMKMPDLLCLLRPDQLPLMKKRIANRIKSERGKDFSETVLMHKKGFEVYIDVAMKEIETTAGLASFNIIRDITHRKLSEQALKKSERQFRFMFEKARATVCLLDENGSITNLNPAFETTLEHPRIDWIGKPFLLLVNPEDLGKYMECFNGARTSSNEYETKVRLVKGNLENVEVEISVAGILDDGQVDTIMLILKGL